MIFKTALIGLLVIIALLLVACEEFMLLAPDDTLIDNKSHSESIATPEKVLTATPKPLQPLSEKHVIEITHGLISESMVYDSFNKFLGCSPDYPPCYDALAQEFHHDDAEWPWNYINHSLVPALDLVRRTQHSARYKESWTAEYTQNGWWVINAPPSGYWLWRENDRYDLIVSCEAFKADPPWDSGRNKYIAQLDFFVTNYAPDSYDLCKMRMPDIPFQDLTDYAPLAPRNPTDPIPTPIPNPTPTPKPVTTLTPTPTPGAHLPTPTPIPNPTPTATPCH